MTAVRATLSDVAIGGEVAIKGRVLYLTSDGALLQRQLAGENLTFDPQRSLIDNISTDELTPGWVCYYYDETLARYCLVGLRGGIVQKDAIQERRLRRHRQRRLEGLRIVARDGAVLRAARRDPARHRAEHREDLRPERAEHRPAHTTDFALLERIERGEAIPIAEFTAGSIRSARRSSSTAGSSPTTTRAWRARSRRRPSRPPRGR